MSSACKSQKWMREARGDEVDGMMLGEKKKNALRLIDWKWFIFSK